MSAPVAFCPQCHNEVAFVHEGNLRRCPVCGFHYETGAGAVERSASPRKVSGFGLFLRFVLILAALFMIGLGVVFVGCAIALKGL